MSQKTVVKRNCLSLETKLKIVEAVDEQTLKKTEICKKFNIPKSSLSTIISNRQKIYDALASGNFTTKSKKVRAGKFEDVEEILFEWFKEVGNCAGDHTGCQ